MLKINLKNKKALLIDCDGTLGDTLPAHNKAYELAFNLNNVPFNLSEHEEYAPFGGKILMEETVIKKGFGQDVVDNIVQDKQKLLPVCLDKLMIKNQDLIEFIKNRPEHIKAYVVSNGRRNSITQILNRLGLAYVIDGLITPELLGSVKPSPEPYSYAMVVASLDFNEHVGPEDVVVFEDNQVGIDSAKAANIKDIIKINTEDFSYEKI